MTSENAEIDQNERLIAELRLAVLPAPRERAKIRRHAGASLRDVAAPLDVSPFTVLRWERGDVEPKRRNAIRYRVLLDKLRDVGR